VDRWQLRGWERGFVELGSGRKWDVDIDVEDPGVVTDQLLTTCHLRFVANWFFVVTI
jgi:hypothetical protein